MLVLLETIICILLGAFIFGALVGWIICRWLDKAQVEIDSEDSQ